MKALPLFILLLVLILDCSASPQGKLHSHLTRPTKVECESTNDCLDHYSRLWCLSGTVCIRGFCHTIPAYPCKQDQLCIEESQQCVHKICSSWKDCDDGLFCNGIEKCINSVCVSDPRHACTHGHCSEATKSCSTPLLLKNLSIKAQLHVMDDNTSAPTTNSNSTSPTTDTTLAITIGAVAVFLFIATVIIFLFASMRSGTGTEPPMLVITRRAEEFPDDNLGDPSTDYIHEFHYNQY